LTKGGESHLNPISASKTESNPVPRVLLQAKKEAAVQTPGKGKPWDKGHWSNRK